ncbi:hypothetical protein LSAT2_016745, partial [Lamellibrachia satsuma]
NRRLFRRHSTGVYQSGDQGTSHLKCVSVQFGVWQSRPIQPKITAIRYSHVD